MVSVLALCTLQLVSPFQKPLKRLTLLGGSRSKSNTNLTESSIENLKCIAKFCTLR